jgi:hypothetical protein
MARAIILLISFLFACQPQKVIHQPVEEPPVLELPVNDDFKHGFSNALPPGPSRIWGQLVDEKQNPVANATITACYPDSIVENGYTTKSGEDGRFTFYVTQDDQPWIELHIILEGKLIGKFRYNNPGGGQNIGSPYTPMLVKP